MSDHEFPDLTGAWAETRQALHLYANVIGVVPRAHVAAHPKWWHVSLKVAANGLRTDDINLPDGGTFYLQLDLQNHNVVLATSQGEVREFSMTAGWTGSQMGDRVLTAVAGLGLTGEYMRQKFESDEPLRYDREAARRFWTAVQLANSIFEKHRSNLNDGEIDLGIVQLWPHGFDLSFEWFGTRVEEYEEQGEVKAFPAQLNLGFYPGGTPAEQYFYSNPWPFAADALVNKPLPEGARWFTESWQGSILPYAELIGDKKAEARLLSYARAVYDLARPTLMA